MYVCVCTVVAAIYASLRTGGVKTSQTTSSLNVSIIYAYFEKERHKRAR